MVKKGREKMFLFKRKSAEEKAIEQEIQDMKLYLENNYKDLAIGARKKATQLVNTAYEEGKITKSSYEQYSQILEHYTKEMSHYNHQEFYHS